MATYTYNEIKNMKPSALSECKTTRYGLLDNGMNGEWLDHPFLMEDITLYSYDKHDLCRWISEESLAGIEMIKTALSDETRAGDAQRIHDNWFPDDVDGDIKVSVFTNQIVMGQIGRYIYDGIIDTMGDKTYKGLKDMLLGCDHTYVWRSDGRFCGDFGTFMIYDKRGVRDTGRKRFLTSASEHDAVQTVHDIYGFRLHNDDVGGYGGDDLMDLLRKDQIVIDKDDGSCEFHYIYTTPFSIPIPNILSIAYTIYVEDKTGKESGRYMGNPEIWYVDRGEIEKMDKYFIENHPDLPSYREY